MRKILNKMILLIIAIAMVFTLKFTYTFAVNTGILKLNMDIKKITVEQQVQKPTNSFEDFLNKWFN